MIATGHCSIYRTCQSPRKAESGDVSRLFYSNTQNTKQRYDCARVHACECVRCGAIAFRGWEYSEHDLEHDAPVSLSAKALSIQLRKLKEYDHSLQTEPPPFDPILQHWSATVAFSRQIRSTVVVKVQHKGFTAGSSSSSMPIGEI